MARSKSLLWQAEKGGCRVSITDLPETVVQVWGPTAAQDFVQWLDERLRTAPAFPRISAFVARQQVNVLMLEQVSNLLLAGDPRLIQVREGNWRWRVPVSLTLPGHGCVGLVGEIDVDAVYGGVYCDDTLLTNIATEAERLATQATNIQA
jgi:hypothetical protein